MQEIQQIYYTNTTQKLILDSHCFFILHLSQHKLKRVALLRKSLKNLEYKIQGFPRVYWTKSKVPLIQKSAWFPTTNANFIVYTSKSQDFEKFLLCVSLIQQMEGCIILTKYQYIFRDVFRLLKFCALKQENFLFLIFLAQNLQVLHNLVYRSKPVLL